jgi:predicted PolB exonuclease-like 3'-5' exonuclease
MVIRKFKSCDDCAIAKAKQASVLKMTKTKRDKPGEQIFIHIHIHIHISAVKGESYGRAKFWLLALDDKTEKLFGFFLTKKSENKDKIVAWIKDLKTKHVQYARKGVTIDCCF